MAMIGKIKWICFRDEKSVREILQLAFVWRNTARMWIQTPVREEPRHLASEKAGRGSSRRFTNPSRRR